MEHNSNNNGNGLYPEINGWLASNMVTKYKIKNKKVDDKTVIYIDVYEDNILEGFNNEGLSNFPENVEYGNVTGIFNLPFKKFKGGRSLFENGDGIGIIRNLKKWLSQYGIHYTDIPESKDDNKTVFHIDAYLDNIFDNFNDEDFSNLPIHLKFGDVTGIFKLINLDNRHKYFRLRKYYQSFMVKWVNKSQQEKQADVLGRKRPCSPKDIDNSIPYISNLSKDPTNTLIVDLANEVVGGILGCLNYDKDEFEIAMETYARRILESFNKQNKGFIRKL